MQRKKSNIPRPIWKSTELINRGARGVPTILDYSTTQIEHYFMSAKT
jgi:hypothetical protein